MSEGTSRVDIGDVGDTAEGGVGGDDSCTYEDDECQHLYRLIEWRDDFSMFHKNYK